MSRKIAKVASVGLAAAALVAFGPAGNAAAANQVPCDNDEYAKIDYRLGGDLSNPVRHTECWANAGEVKLPDEGEVNYPEPGARMVNWIWSGNNEVRVQLSSTWYHTVPKQTWFTPPPPGLSPWYVLSIEIL